MPFITVNLDNLEVDVVARRPRKGIAVPADRSDLDFSYDELPRTVWFGGCYGYRTPGAPAEARPRAAFITQPDPWLVAIGAIMWEGLLQGLTWEVIKVAVLSAISKLREKGLAPKISGREIREKRTKTQVGFSWQKLSKDGEELENFFVGLQRTFQYKSHVERVHVTRPEEWERLRAEHFAEEERELKRAGKRKGVDYTVLPATKPAGRSTKKQRRKKRGA